jgi:hypothetical protein
MGTAFCLRHSNQRKSVMPIIPIVLWAVPAIFVVGGLTYVLVK